MNTEQWKPVTVTGFEAHYQISSLSNVRSLYGKGRILKPYKNKKGYLVVTLSHKGKRKLVKIHRLVAMAFLPNPHNYLEVHHEFDKLDNRPEALSWVNHHENNTHAKRQKPKTSRLTGVSKAGKRWRAKACIDGQHKHLGVFDTEEEAQKAYLKALADHGIINRYAA